MRRVFDQMRCTFRNLTQTVRCALTERRAVYDNCCSAALRCAVGASGSGLTTAAAALRCRRCELRSHDSCCSVALPALRSHDSYCSAALPALRSHDSCCSAALPALRAAVSRQLLQRRAALPALLSHDSCRQI